jgi:hypothetical protein
MEPYPFIAAIPSSEETTWGARMACFLGAIILLASAIKALPRLSAAIVKICRGIIALADIMPFIPRLPEILDGHTRMFEQQNNVLAQHSSALGKIESKLEKLPCKEEPCQIEPRKEIQ